jgi:hypothetical protein
MLLVFIYFLHQNHFLYTQIQIVQDDGIGMTETQINRINHDLANHDQRQSEAGMASKM